ncbi:MAG: terminase large subunit [Bacteroidales bacterium]|nr:terminase large subunit [Bacteroidales bacterium]
MINHIKKYYDEITSGKIVVGKKIKQQYEKLIWLLDNPEENYIKDYKGDKQYFYYNEKAAEKPIGFIEKFCHHIKGELSGQLIKLESWQKAAIAALYGFVSVKGDLRRFQRFHLYVARKNGKTILITSLIIYELSIGGEMGAEVYTGATKMEQAKIAWDMAKTMIQRSPVLNKRFSIVLNGIYRNPYRDSFYKPISKDSKKLDGLNAHITHIDELHAIVDNNIVDVMWDSTKSRKQPIEFITTTMGTERESTFDEIYEYDSKVISKVFKDDRLLVFCYELDEVKEWHDIRLAYKANPNLGISQSINKFNEEIQKAENDDSRLSNLLCKSFNVRQTSKHAWLAYEDFDKREVYDLTSFKDPIVIGGFDLSRTGDLTAFTTLVFDKENKKIIAETMYWATEKYIESAKKVPFKLWIEKGLVRVSGKELINYDDIVDYVMEKVNAGFLYQFIGYDSYSAGYLINKFESVGFAKEYVLKKVHQGAKTLSIPMQELEGDLKRNKFLYQNNPVTKWCFSNVELETDRNGNYMPVKGGRERKIDGVATILNCYAMYVKNIDYFWEVD